MSTEITFNDNNNFKYKSRTVLGTAQVPGMTKFLISKGIVKSEGQATNLIMILIIIFMSTSIYIVYNSFYTEPSLSNLSPTDESALKGDLNISN